MISLVFVQPEIPANVGALLRLSACWQITLNLVGPFSFVWSDRNLKRAALDYLPQSIYAKYDSWESYCAIKPTTRKIFLVPHQPCNYHRFSFLPDDALIFGSESCGFAPNVQSCADFCVSIPTIITARSMNVAMAAAIVTAEAMRQTGQFDKI